MTIPTFENRSAFYAHAWADLQINPDRMTGMQTAARTILAHRDRYAEIEAETGVPWYVVGLFHYRESNCNFSRHLHNGDPLTARTVKHPPGRPIAGNPPFTFKESAIDCIKLEKFDRFRWDSIERIAFALESMNGFGYYFRGLPSAYLFAGTNQYEKGKFTDDKVFDPNVVDKQMGALGVLKCLEDLEPGTLIPSEGHPSFEASPSASPDPTTDSDAHEDLLENSRKYSLMQRIKLALGIGGGTAAVGKTATDAGLDDPWAILSSAAHFVSAFGFEICIVALGAAIAALMFLQHLQREDVKNGRAVPSGRAS